MILRLPTTSIMAAISGTATTPFMIAIQMVTARIGAVTGRGLAANLSKAMPAAPLYGNIVQLSA